MGLPTLIFAIGIIIVLLVVLPNLATNLFQAKGQADYNLQKQKADDASFKQKGLFGSISTFFLGEGDTTSNKAQDTKSPAKVNPANNPTLDTGQAGEKLYRLPNGQQAYLTPDAVAFYQKSGANITPISPSLGQTVSHDITRVFH